MKLAYQLLVLLALVAAFESHGQDYDETPEAADPSYAAEGFEESSYDQPPPPEYAAPEDSEALLEVPHALGEVPASLEDVTGSMGD
jgi:hypothetical protein